LKFVKPFPFGQFTPRFWGWAGGTGTSDGVLASLLNAAFHSPNIIHHHAGTWVDRQVLEWLREAPRLSEDYQGQSHQRWFARQLHRAGRGTAREWG
jgi:hypothetical protein